MTVRAIAVLLAAALASRAACQITEFERAADEWLAAVDNAEIRAFDEWVPGLEQAGGCLNPDFEPVTLDLEDGIIIVSAFNAAGEPRCSLWDGTNSSSQVSDGFMQGPPNAVTLQLEFDPPIEAFCSYYSSLATGRTSTMRLFEGEKQVAELEGPVSDHNVGGIGHGFTSTTPIDRIEVTTEDDEDNSISHIGAFVALAPDEPSLGQVTIPGYDGPSGTSTIDLDFGVSFLLDIPTCLAADIDDDGFVGTGDFLLVLAQWGPCPPDCFADIDGDGTVGVLDFLTVLAEWGPCQ